jgi:hypothetical protein
MSFMLLANDSEVGACYCKRFKLVAYQLGPQEETAIGIQARELALNLLHRRQTITTGLAQPQHRYAPSTSYHAIIDDHGCGLVSSHSKSIDNSMKVHSSSGSPHPEVDFGSRKFYYRGSMALVAQGVCPRRREECATANSKGWCAVYAAGSCHMISSGRRSQQWRRSSRTGASITTLMQW